MSHILPICQRRLWAKIPGFRGMSHPTLRLRSPKVARAQIAGEPGTATHSMTVSNRQSTYFNRPGHHPAQDLLVLAQMLARQGSVVVAFDHLAELSADRPTASVRPPECRPRCRR